MERISGVNLAKKQYKITDYKKFTKSAVDVIVEEKGIFEGFNRIDTEYNLPMNMIESYYFIGERGFVYCNDGYFYECVPGDMVNPVYMGEKVLSAVEIMSGDQRKILFAGEKGRALLVSSSGREEINTLPEVNALAVFNGRLFAASKNSVYFFAPFDFLTNSTLLTGGGKLNVSAVAGEVVGFYEQNKKLYIICEHLIYRLTALNEGIEFTLEKVDVPYIDVKKHTVKAIFDKCVFISGNKLCILSGERLIEKSGLIKGVNIDKLGVAARIDGSYLLPVRTTENKSYIYTYGVEEESESFIKTSCLAVADQGYLPDYNCVIKLDLTSGSNSGGVWQSENLTFNTLCDKTLLEIFAFASAKCILTVKGACGVKKFTLKKGYNRRKLNFNSRAFNFSIEQKESGFSITDLRFIYTVRGE